MKLEIKDVSFSYGKLMEKTEFFLKMYLLLWTREGFFLSWGLMERENQHF